MTSQLQYTSLTDFLIKHNAKDEARKNMKSTHNRIGDMSASIFPGSYVIGLDELPVFYELYYNHVFVQKKMEYLTERQIEDGSQSYSGPVLIDFDFRYDYAVVERQHDKQFVMDILGSLYLEELKEFFVFENASRFEIFVMEKPHVNRVSDKEITKDGIHIIMGLQMDHTMQEMLRDRIIKKFPDYSDLPLTNDMEQVFDLGISQGSVGWQMYGSRKPGNEAYALTGYYAATYDMDMESFVLTDLNVASFNVSQNFYKMSAQYGGNPVFPINPKIADEYNARAKLGASQKSKKGGARNIAGGGTRISVNACDDGDSDDENEIVLEDIIDKNTLEREMTKIIEMLKKSGTANDYSIIEAHEFAQILPAKYYEPGSHLLNRQVAFALKRTSEKLFLSWIMLRSKADDFEYNTILPLYEKWRSFNQDRTSGVTKRSLLYWARQDAYDDYVRVKKTTIDYFVEETLKRPNEYDFAYVLSQMFKDRYVCVGIKSKTWYMFKNHHWVLDEGLTLRNLISKDLHDLYQIKLTAEIADMGKLDATTDADLYNQCREKIKNISNISLKFKKTTDKNNIMTEAAEIFWDGEFIRNMDSNRYLLCFTNGVVDLKTGAFRNGYPSDYITKCTNIPYIPYDKIPKDIPLGRSTTIAHDIVTFMEQLFPIPELNKYMWDHLASTLIGENVNQYFNIYRGSGSNGKSLLVDLMTIVLGELKGILPITLITDNRGKVGGTCSELIQLKGCRYAVMQEPKKDMTLNEGIMKEITGEKFMQGRELFQKSEVFAIQFQPVVCTNSLFRVDSNDDGTWRRMKIVDFMAKFVDEGEEHTDDTLYVFPKDKGLKDRLPDWAPIFASMLVSRAVETQGIVRDCEMVSASTMKYRHGQDHISSFVKECIVKNPEGKLKKTGVMEAFKLWMQLNQGGCKIPKGNDLYEYMDKRFGKYKSNLGWTGVELVQTIDTDDIHALDS